MVGNCVISNVSYLTEAHIYKLLVQFPVFRSSNKKVLKYSIKLNFLINFYETYNKGNIYLEWNSTLLSTRQLRPPSFMNSSGHPLAHLKCSNNCIKQIFLKSVMNNSENFY